MFGLQAKTVSSAPKDQWSTSIETFKFVVDLMVKAWAFLVAVNGVLIGYGFLSLSAGPIFLGALVSAVSALMPALISRSLIPLAYSAYVAEKQLLGSTPGLVQIYARTAFKRLSAEFEALGAGTDAGSLERVRLIAHGRSFIGKRVTVLLVFVVVAQLFLGVYFVSAGSPLFNTAPIDTFSLPPAPTVPLDPIPGPTVTP
uniref:hypothetical protein n=1 Tax=Arthrobacter sp. TaxID=1667 RepID=UPI000EB6C6F7|nr:hypothetical protein [Arthrobacter sp.]AXV46656.1 hypothetical protein pA58H3_p41 [Arthrobacter sp.]